MAAPKRAVGSQRPGRRAEHRFWLLFLRVFPDSNPTLGSRPQGLVAEVFHRAMEGSRTSIVRDPTWRPALGRGQEFRMVDLLLFAFEDKAELINPLG